MASYENREHNDEWARRRGNKKNAIVTTRINEDLKQEGEAVLKELGISASGAIAMLYRFLAVHKRMPMMNQEVLVDDAVKVMIVGHNVVPDVVNLDQDIELSNTGPSVKIIVDKEC